MKDLVDLKLEPSIARQKGEVEEEPEEEEEAVDSE